VPIASIVDTTIHVLVFIILLLRTAAKPAANRRSACCRVADLARPRASSSNLSFIAFLSFWISAFNPVLQEKRRNSCREFWDFIEKEVSNLTAHSLLQERTGIKGKVSSRNGTYRKVPANPAGLWLHCDRHQERGRPGCG